MSKRSERKERADRKRAKIEEELRKFMLRTAKTEGEAKVGWDIVLREAEAWVERRTKMFPLEAHMYRMATRALQSKLMKVIEFKQERRT